jgi:NTE family protein
MSNLAATQNFDAFRYTLKTESGKEVLKMTPPESKHTTLFRGSLHYDKLIGALALANLTKKHAFLKNDEISLDIMLGAYFQYAMSYFIDKGEFWSVGLSAKQHQFDTSAPVSLNTDQFAISKPTNTRVLVQKNTWYVQTLFREEVVLGVGLAHQHNVFKTNLFDTQTARFLYTDNADYYSVLGYLKVDTRDDKFYPKKGGFFDGDINYYFSEKSSREDINFTPFLIAKANMGAILPLDSKWSLLLSTSGGFTVGGATSSAFDFTFGGYGNAPVLNYQTFIGLPQQHVAGDSFVKAETTIDYEFTPKHHLKMLLNGGIVSTDIFSTGQWKRGIDYYSAGMAYGLETFAGPIELTAAYSPQFSRLLFHVNIGWQF